MALEPDDEVGQGGGLDVLGDAELEAELGGHRRHGQEVDVLDDERPDARATTLGTAAVTSSSVRVRRQDGHLVLRAAGTAAGSPR